MYRRSCLTPPPTPLQLSNLVLSMTSGHRDMRVVNPSSFVIDSLKLWIHQVFLKKMLTALGHIQLLRFVGPAVVVFGVAPYYLITWLAWRLASLPLSRRVFERGDEIMYDSYQSLICFFFETLTGAEVRQYYECC